MKQKNNWQISLYRVQLGYTVQLQGRASEAQVLYQKVLKMKPSDTALIAIAANNSATINGSQNVFDSRRKLKLARAALDGTEAKLTSRQRQALSVNQCLFLGLTSQVASRRITESNKVMFKGHFYFCPPGGLVPQSY